MIHFVAFKGRSITDGQKIKVYRNLRNRLFSIVDYSSGLVLGHAGYVTLKDVKFKVNQKARNEVIKSGVKNVHAFLIGNFILDYNYHVKGLQSIYYNPYFVDSFVRESNGEKIFEVDKAICYSNKVYI